MELRKAKALAEEFIHNTPGNKNAPWFDRVEVAGSIRRGKPDVKDIEIVAIPAKREEVVERDMFGEVVKRTSYWGFEMPFNVVVNSSVYGWDWELDRELPRNGPKYKRLRHKPTGICMDLFLTDPAGWGICYTIRTGPGEFSKALVTLASRMGMHITGNRLHKHPKVDGKPCSKGADCPLIIPTPNEETFLEALGLPWIPPEQRKSDIVWRWLGERSGLFHDRQPN